MDSKLGLSKKLKKINPMDEIYGLNSSDDSSTSKRIENIPVEMLIHYKKHKFELYTGKRKLDLINNIKSNGILMPIIVTPDENGYYMVLAGHNRLECGKEAGLKEIPAIILNNVSEEDAEEIVIITNLFQRSFSELPISKKAEIISDYYNLLQKKGRDISEIKKEIEQFYYGEDDDEQDDVSPVGTGTRQVGEKYSLSKNTIARLLRIHTLIQELKDKIDTEKISKRVGVDLSYLDHEYQEYINQIISTQRIKLDTKKSEKLKMLYLDSKLTLDIVEDILLGRDKEIIASKNKSIKLNSNIINKYFQDNQDKKEIEKIIEEALKIYFKEN